MNSHHSSRRGFLQQAAALTGASWAKALLPGVAAIAQAACSAKDEQAAFTILGASEATELAAIAARIIPTTDTPGANEAGVIYFIDQTLGSFNAGKLPDVRGGLEQFQSGIEGNELFSDLSAEQQDAYLQANQETPFFAAMRFLTVCGYFGMSQYGGNRDGVGWQLLGMDPTIHAYESPFGYYDAEYMKENPGG